MNTEQFGNQGGFGDISMAAGAMEKGSGVFQTSMGKWTAGILTFKTLVDSDAFKSFGQGSVKMTSVLGDLGSIFSKSKMVDMFSNLTASVFSTIKAVESSFGMFGKANTQIVRTLREQTSATIKYGIDIKKNLESYTALATQFQSVKFALEPGMAAEVSKISKSFDLGAGEAADLIGQLVKFGGMKIGEIDDGKGVKSFFDDIDRMSKKEGFFANLTAKNMAGASKHMFRFLDSSGKGLTNFKSMAVYATKIGADMATMIEAVDKFRTVPGAIQGSIDLSMAGLNISAGELLSIGTNDDGEALNKRVMDHLIKFTDPKTGALTSTGIIMADLVKDSIGMSREGIAGALMRLNPDAQSPEFKFGMQYEERLQNMQTIMAKVNNAILGLMDKLTPTIEKVVRGIDKIANHTTLLQSIFGVMFAGWAAQKVFQGLAAAHFMWQKGQRAIGATRDIIQRTKYPVFSQNGFTDNATVRGRGQKISGKRRISRIWGSIRGGGDDTETSRGRSSKSAPRSAPPVSGSQAIGQSKLMGAQAAQMAASAVAMIGFAAATWILAKAFQQFGTVDWAQAKYGGLVMAGLGAVMIILGATMTAGAAPILAMSVLFVSFAASTFIMGKALGEFVKPLYALRDVDLVGIGLGLGSLALGMVALMAIGATGLAGAIFGGSGLAMVGVTVASLGKVAEKYATPIDTLSIAMERMAEAMGSLNDLGAVGVDIDVNEKTLKSLKKLSMDLYGSSVTKKDDMVETHITLNIDGDQFLKKVVKTRGMRGGF